MQRQHRGHPQVKIEISKTIKADEGIAPLIAWMNEQPNIITHFSCQGRGEEGTGFPRPMVSFHAITRNAFYKLLRKVGLDRDRYEDESRGIRATWWDVHGNTNYKLEWDTRRDLDRTMTELGLIKNGL